MIGCSTTCRIGLESCSYPRLIASNWNTRLIDIHGLSKPASGSAITMRPPSSARAAWGRSIRRAMPNSTAQSRSTSCFGGYVGDRDRVVALEWPQEAT